MRIFGIDPGQNESGYAIIDDHWPDAGIIKAGVIDNVDIIDLIECGYVKETTSVAIEMISSYGMRVGDSTFQTCVWIGRMAQACYAQGIEPVLIKRTDVKKILLPGKKANDSVLRQELIRRMKWSADDVRKESKRIGLKSHAWQALAVAAAARSILCN